METICNPFDYPICKPYGVPGANHIKYQINSIWNVMWNPYGVHVTLPSGIAAYKLAEL